MAGKAWQAMKGVQAIFIAYIISLGAIGYAYNANTVAVKEADIRAAQFKIEADARNAALEDQTRRLQFAFCGLQPYSAITTPAPTESAKILREVVGNATSPQGLNCTPDPFDGK